MPIPDKLWSAGDPPRDPAHPDADPSASAAEPAEPGPAQAKPRRGRLLVALAAAAALGAAGAAVTLGGNEARAPTALPAASAPLPSLRDSGNSVREVYRAASPAVVSVRTGGGEGTGFVIDRDGTIVTNAHVVGDATRAQVQFGDDGRTVLARISGTDPSSDLAVLRVDAGAVSGITPLPLADSENVRVGDEVVAIGNPFGLDRTATAGIVSAVGREITAPNGFSIDRVLQTDAPINPGNSGGPLLDANGRVIGVNSQIRGGNGGGNVGIGFAVPSNVVREVAPRLARGESIERAYLGVSTSPAGGSARVESVTPGSPAQQAGIRAGDVIASVGGRQVDDPADIAAAIAGRRPGERVELELTRGGATETVTVELGTRPANPTG